MSGHDEHELLVKSYSTTQPPARRKLSIGDAEPDPSGGEQRDSANRSAVVHDDDGNSRAVSDASGAHPHQHPATDMLPRTRKSNVAHRGGMWVTDFVKNTHSTLKITLSKCTLRKAPRPCHALWERDNSDVLIAIDTKLHTSNV